jgi:hypothetical protein
VAASTATLVLWHREEGERLTAALLADARARWQRHRPRAYDLEVVVSGAQEGAHRIEVREGRVVKMTTGGGPVRENVWEYWTVDGMFRFLADELGNVERPEAAYGVAQGSEVVLRVVFDETYGYPARFLRHVIGSRQSVEWRIRGFVPQD